MADYEETFFGGIGGLTRVWQKRRAPLRYGEGDSLPPLDVDLAALASTYVEDDPAPLKDKDGSFRTRWSDLRGELKGCTELAFLNSLVIVNLRKREFPDHAPALFHRIWREHGQQLIDELTGRWLISSMITFADHGETEADRRVAQSLNILFSLMKLYESERLYSGLTADKPFRPEDRRVSTLPLDMEPFSLMRGDLEPNLLAPILVDARAAPTAGPLAKQLLDLLNRDDRTMFRRFALMRADIAFGRDPGAAGGSGQTD